MNNEIMRAIQKEMEELVRKGISPLDNAPAPAGRMTVMRLDFNSESIENAIEDLKGDIADAEFAPEDYNNPEAYIKNHLLAISALELIQSRLEKEPRHRRATWEPTGQVENWNGKAYECSCCGRVMIGRPEYCPQCGSSMTQRRDE